MPRSPTSSEDEMAQSFSDYSEESGSDSSKEETIYETIRATAERPSSRMEDIHINSLVIRVIIPDLQQTVRGLSSFIPSWWRMCLSVCALVVITLFGYGYVLINQNSWQISN